MRHTGETRTHPSSGRGHLTGHADAVTTSPSTIVRSRLHLEALVAYFGERHFTAARCEYANERAIHETLPRCRRGAPGSRSNPTWGARATALRRRDRGSRRRLPQRRHLHRLRPRWVPVTVLPSPKRLLPRRLPHRMSLALRTNRTLRACQTSRPRCRPKSPRPQPRLPQSRLALQSPLRSLRRTLRSHHHRLSPP